MANLRNPDELYEDSTEEGLDAVNGITYGEPDPNSNRPPSMPSQPKAGAPFDSRAFLGGWMGYGNATTQGLDEYIRQAGGGRVRRLDGDKVSIDGRIHDLIKDSGTARAKARTGYTTDPRFKAGATSGTKGKGSKSSSKYNVSAGTAGTPTAPVAPQAPQAPGLTFEEMSQRLRKMMDGGGYNEALVQNRISSASDDLTRQMNSRMATNRAALAERGMGGGGQIGMEGPAVTAMNRATENLYDRFAGTIRDIRGDEMQAADARQAQALSLATGMTMEQSQQVIDKFRADTDRSRANTDRELGHGRLSLDRELGRGSLALGNRNAGITERLGLGNLALGNSRATNDYNLGLGNLGLGRDRLQYDMDNGDIDRMLEIMRGILGGANTSSGGFR